MINKISVTVTKYHVECNKCKKLLWKQTGSESSSDEFDTVKDAEFHIEKRYWFYKKPSVLLCCECKDALLTEYGSNIKENPV